MNYSDRISDSFRSKSILATLDKSCEVTSFNENNRVISNSIYHALFKIQLSSVIITLKLKVASQHLMVWKFKRFQVIIEKHLVQNHANMNIKNCLTFAIEILLLERAVSYVIIKELPMENLATAMSHLRLGNFWYFKFYQISARVVFGYADSEYHLGIFDFGHWRALARTCKNQNISAGYMKLD